MNTVHKGMVHVLSRMELDSAGFQQTTQKGMQFKTYELFISEIFHSLFLTVDN